MPFNFETNFEICKKKLHKQKITFWVKGPWKGFLGKRSNSLVIRRAAAAAAAVPPTECDIAYSSLLNLFQCLPQDNILNNDIHPTSWQHQITLKLTTESSLVQEQQQQQACLQRSVTLPVPTLLHTSMSATLLHRSMSALLQFEPFNWASELLRGSFNHNW